MSTSSGAILCFVDTVKIRWNRTALGVSCLYFGTIEAMHSSVLFYELISLKASY